MLLLLPLNNRRPAGCVLFRRHCLVRKVPVLIVLAHLLPGLLFPVHQIGTGNNPTILWGEDLLTKASPSANAFIIGHEMAHIVDWQSMELWDCLQNKESS